MNSRCNLPDVLAIADIKETVIGSSETVVDDTEIQKEREREGEKERELKGFDRERNANKKPLLEILWCDDYKDSLHGVWNSGTV
jgi:hypothetical protein